MNRNRRFLIATGAALGGMVAVTNVSRFELPKMFEQAVYVGLVAVIAFGVVALLSMTRSQRHRR